MTARFAVLLLLFACRNDTPTFAPIVEADADTDADADADTDTDTDADADVDGLDCTPGAYPTPSPGSAGPTCLTEVIACGDTVYGTNEGGSLHYGTGPGEQFEQCSGSNWGTDFDGPERVYQLPVPPEVNSVYVTFDSCTDSEMMFQRTSSACPTGLLSQCGYLTEGTDRSQQDAILVGSSGYLHFVIEGMANDGGNYRFTVECYE